MATCSPRVGITLAEWHQARLRRRLTKDRLVQVGVRQESLPSSVLFSRSFSRFAWSVVSQPYSRFHR
jgi:hypothetical protein